MSSVLYGLTGRQNLMPGDTTAGDTIFDSEENLEAKNEDECMTEDYKLHTNEFGYSIYTDEEIPIITHSANPIIHSRDEETGNMEDEEIPDSIKQALYIMLKINRAEDDRKAEALYGVYQKIVQEQMNQIQQEITNLVFNNSELTDGTEIEELNEFKDWCILSCDPEKVMEYQFVTKSVEEAIEAEESV